MADTLLIPLGIFCTFGAIGIAIAYYVLQRDPTSPFCRAVRRVGKLASSLLIVGLIVALAGDAIYEYGAKISHIALGFLTALVVVLSETWQVWVIVAAAMVWCYSYRKNRQRQQEIIEILSEIRRKLN